MSLSANKFAYLLDDCPSNFTLNALLGEGYASGLGNVPFDDIHAQCPTWRKRGPWQSKYLHRYYVFIKFSFSPSKVTKIFLSLSSSFSNNFIVRSLTNKSLITLFTGLAPYSGT